MTADLFESVANVLPAREAMAEGAVLLRGFAGSREAALLAALREVEAQAPFRRMFTPGGHQMSVAMTNCGEAAVFAVHHRPVQGTRGTYRVNLRHGVSRLRSGRRHTVGIIFHDAK